MSVEAWKTIFDIAAVVFVGLTFAAGAGAFIARDIINKRQAIQLRQFDKGLTDAKSELVTQQERAAIAESRTLQLRTDLENATAESKTR
jgi:hypothetical protein